ncbi:hypothetical protein [Natronoarchaeum rubrum]|uniref:hypothetical protein n=1 Tax=Natronoarchaeum rubrum TaxID=755311 RepID=UPI00211244B1|nr:hypothetical protein [Natronoarchaeum rubrum]
MFPESGSGSIQVGPTYPQRRHPIPLHLRPLDEANTKYQLANALDSAGECYCEVSLDGRDQIDLVWVDTSSDDQRVVGIEIKTASQFKQATHKLESQIDRYRNKTVQNLTSATAVIGDVITSADETYVFDEVWVLAVGDRDRWELPWRDDTPEDGWLNYDPFTGQLEYSIDATQREETIQFDFEQRVGEAQLTASLWDHYQSTHDLVAAESWFSKPRHRLISDSRLKYHAGKGQQGKRKQADLVVSDYSEFNPLRYASTIRGIEVKASFDGRVRSQLDDQLPLYCDSKLFSEVYLAIPEGSQQEAIGYLESNHPRVGLLTADMDRSKVTLQRDAERLELQKVPVGRCGGSDPDFQL